MEIGIESYGPPLLSVLSPSDIQQAAAVIERLFSGTATPEEQQLLQHQLFELQKRPESWGLVAPFLAHSDPNVQFFGAHTCQIKIVRDWDTFPQQDRLLLRDALLHLTARAISAGRPKLVLRKLFVALTSLALQLFRESSSLWPEWIISTTSFLSAQSTPREYILDFLAIIAEEISRSDLIPSTKSQIQQVMINAVPLFRDVVVSSLTDPDSSDEERIAALKTLEAWVSWGLPANDLTALLPLLISLLSNITLFIPASETLHEILTKSSLANGKGAKVLTEPLLAWVESNGRPIVEQSITAGFCDDLSLAFCKLLVALGDHSSSFLATHLPDPHVQTHLKLILNYTGFPGWYSIDEEVSEMTIQFWVYFGEAVLDADYIADPEGNHWLIAKAVFSEVVNVLRVKCTWPSTEKLAEWPNDQKDIYKVYRRDIGDVLINAYYILRDDMLESLISPVVQTLSMTPFPDGAWENVEASLYCIKRTQEAVPSQDNRFLALLFSPDILGRIPISGNHRVRRTAITVLGEYTSWFATQPTELLLQVVSFVIAALPEPSLSSAAASALKDICDANRASLAPHIGAFASLYAGLNVVADDDKAKVLQSITSVIQALPPSQAVGPVEAIMQPIVVKLVEALNTASRLPEEARVICVVELQALSACAKGLTSAVDLFFTSSDDPESAACLRQMDEVQRVRKDEKMQRLRLSISEAIRRVMELWSTDPEIASVISDLFKSITALPSDATLLSLEPATLLELACAAANRQLTAVWISLSEILIFLLDPPPILTLKSSPGETERSLVAEAAQSLIHSSLRDLSQPGVMESNPDVVQNLFACMSTITQNFTSVMLRLPQEVIDGLLRCATMALTLQERYSLVASCKFLCAIVRRGMSSDGLVEETQAIMHRHGRSIVQATLQGVAIVAPRSTLPNLSELLSTLVFKLPNESCKWAQDVLFSDEFVSSKASHAAKERFMKIVIASRSTKITGEAVLEFALIARGLEGTSFGLSSVSSM